MTHSLIHSQITLQISTYRIERRVKSNKEQWQIHRNFYATYKHRRLLSSVVGDCCTSSFVVAALKTNHFQIQNFLFFLSTPASRLSRKSTRLKSQIFSTRPSLFADKWWINWKKVRTVLCLIKDTSRKKREEFIFVQKIVLRKIIHLFVWLSFLLPRLMFIIKASRLVH